MKKVATDFYSFVEMRTEGFMYVDKTLVTLIGISFSSGKRTIVEELVEEQPARL